MKLQQIHAGFCRWAALYSLFSLFYLHEGNPVWLTFLLFAFMPLAGRRKARTRE
jgi:hypothetical protein